MYFKYDHTATDYLTLKDPILGNAISKIGKIERPIQTDLFESLVNSIVGQQISTAAHKTIWKRITAHYGSVTPEKICKTELEELQKFGISFRKAAYILENSQKILSGEFDIQSLESKSDDEVIKELCALKGIGIWTAEMLMIFCMQRQDILSYGDLAILRGMRLLYRHRKIDRKRFEVYRRRYSPYGSVASLYIWAIAGGAFPALKDPAPKVKK
ncbi:MAG: DNA-3-methyladenine glycosylase 2 family protein [Clostridia bacterium]|nr:DNA-3-methyladenine glycosylase 2 family protein [Clostridia bacterium]